MTRAVALVRIRAARRTFAKALPEIAVATAALGGWALVTAVVAHFLGFLAWVGSAGLLLLSLCGWLYLWKLITKGLYTLSQEERK